MAHEARSAFYKIIDFETIKKNNLLEAIKNELSNKKKYILSENLKDIKNALNNSSKPSMIDRLSLDEKRIDDMIASIEDVINLPDPVGKIITSKVLKNGIRLQKIRVPIGVIGIIFESRPSVIMEVASLCIKSSNAVILRGGKEAQNTNRALFSIIKSCTEKLDFPKGFVEFLDIEDKSAIKHLCEQVGLIDLIIPRGGEGLIKAIDDYAKVPVIRHYKGICHAYVDKSADIDMALNICHNAKCQRPSVCNAIEKILVHEEIKEIFLNRLFVLFSSAKVQMRACEKSLLVCPKMDKANERDWQEEYLDLIIAIKVVKDIDEAISHINRYGSHHSDVIIAKDQKAQKSFLRKVDSAAVYVNASTRFTDGGQFGLGAEMGISTDKLHARGPMGLEELTTYKWVGLGNGQIRD